MPIPASHLRLPGFLVAQDFVVSRDQVMAAGLSRRAIGYRLGSGSWRELLPGVYLVGAGEPSRRQLLIAALSYAGPDSAVDDADACRFHGLTSAPYADQRVRVVVPRDSPARTRRFVVVRRAAATVPVVSTARLRYAGPGDAVISVARRLRTERAVLALLSQAVQQRVVTPDDLVLAHVRGTPRNACLTDRCLELVCAGARSAPEADFHRLAEASGLLPPLLYNALLRLPSGARVSPDAIAPDAPLIHETNGRAAHARTDLFDDMQERHDLLTDAGFTVLHNSPRALQLRGRQAIAQFERCYQRLAGQGWPPGVVLLRAAAA